MRLFFIAVSFCLFIISPDSLAQSDSIVNPDVVLINIANLKRDDIAQIILEAERQQAKVIGVDAWFTNLSTDTLLLPTVNSFDNIVLAVMLTQCTGCTCDSLTGQYFPYPIQGHVMVNYVDRRYSPILKHEGEEYLFFSLALLEAFDSTLVKKYFDKKLYKKRIKFYGNYDSYLTMEGSSIINKEYPLPHELKDKIVILGYLGEKIGQVKDPLIELDYKRSALSKGKFPDMYGVIMLTNILTHIMDKAGRR